MPQQTFDVSGDIEIHVRDCSNRVIITGGDDAGRVLANAAGQQDRNILYFENIEKLDLRVPRSAALKIAECEADISVSDVSGPVELSDIEGDVALRNLGDVLIRELEGDLAARQLNSLRGEGAWEGDATLRSIARPFTADKIKGDVSVGDLDGVTVEAVEGDLAARALRGALDLGQVDGDISVRGVAGDLIVRHTDGDFIASGVLGAVDAQDVEGDAVVSVDAIKAVSLRAVGDVVINLPTDGHADIELDAPHGEVTHRGTIRILDRDENHARGILGNGGARVVVESLRGDVIARTGAAVPHEDYAAEFRAPFVEMGKEYKDMGRRIAEEVKQSVNASLGEWGIHQHRHHRHRVSVTADEPSAESEPVEQPRGPAAGSPERQAILDAIARGELSVDDAIRKINGEA